MANHFFLDFFQEAILQKLQNRTLHLPDTTAAFQPLPCPAHPLICKEPCCCLVFRSGCKGKGFFQISKTANRFFRLFFSRGGCLRKSRNTSSLQETSSCPTDTYVHLVIVTSEKNLVLLSVWFPKAGAKISANISNFQNNRRLFSMFFSLKTTIGLSTTD